MEKAEAQYHFHEADRLYKEGHYSDALQHLAELNRAYPNTFNVLFPMVLCLQKLGSVQDAYDRCAALLEEFQDDKHQQKLRPLFGQICRDKAHVAHAVKIDGAVTRKGLIVDAPQVTVLDKSDLIVVGSVEIPWKKILVYCAAIGFFILLLALTPLIFARANAEGNEGFKIAAGVLTVLLQFSMTCLITYTTLWTLSKLPHEDMLRDALDIIVFNICFSLLCFVPFVGWGFALYYLYNHYELSLGEVIIFVLLQAVFQILFLFGILPLVLDENALELIGVMG